MTSAQEHIKTNKRQRQDSAAAHSTTSEAKKRRETQVAEIKKDSMFTLRLTCQDVSEIPVFNVERKLGSPDYSIVDAASITTCNWLEPIILRFSPAILEKKVTHDFKSEVDAVLADFAVCAERSTTGRANKNLKTEAAQTLVNIAKCFVPDMLSSDQMLPKDRERHQAPIRSTSNAKR